VEIKFVETAQNHFYVLEKPPLSKKPLNIKPVVEKSNSEPMAISAGYACTDKPWFAH
jgi:hypothetical protein